LLITITMQSKISDAQSRYTHSEELQNVYYLSQLPAEHDMITD